MQQKYKFNVWTKIFDLDLFSNAIMIVLPVKMHNSGLYMYVKTHILLALYYFCTCVFKDDKTHVTG